MAKFIKILNSATGLNNGDIIINVDKIASVVATAATTTAIRFNSPFATTQLLTLTHTSTGTVPSVRDAINAALIAVPGGDVVGVSLPAGVSVSGVVWA